MSIRRGYLSRCYRAPVGPERCAVLPSKQRNAELSPNTVNLTVESRHLPQIYDGGFTLIEVMVTLLILAILLAIAIPTFLGVTRSAAGRVAQVNSNTALLDSKTTFYTSGQSFPPVATLITALNATEKALTFQTAASTNHSRISIYVATDQSSLIMAVQSNTTKDCWYTIVNGASEAAKAAPRTRNFPLPFSGLVRSSGKQSFQPVGWLQLARPLRYLLQAPVRLPTRAGAFLTCGAG